MADGNFARVQSWEEVLASHDQWVSDSNAQDHWAHQKREDGRCSPGTVLDWVRGRPVSTAELERAFAPVHTTRRTDRHGYVRFLRFGLYGERGLAQKRVVVWLTMDRLVLTSSDEPLAYSSVTVARDRRHLKAVTEDRRFTTPFPSPQPPVWEPDAGEWLRVLQLPAPRPRRHRRAVGEQLPLFARDGDM